MLQIHALTTSLFRYGTFPLMLLGLNGALVALAGNGAPWWQSFLVLFAAIGFMFIAERVIPMCAVGMRTTTIVCATCCISW